MKDVKEEKTEETVEETIVESVSETRLSEIENEFIDLERQLCLNLEDVQRSSVVASLIELHSELLASEEGSKLREAIVKALAKEEKPQNHRSDTKMENQEQFEALQEQVSELTEELKGSHKYASEAQDLRHNLAVLEQALDEMANRYHELESESQESISNLEEELRVSKEREQAAEELLQEYIDKNTENETQLEDQSELQERYNAAEELLDAFIERSQEDVESYNKLQEQLTEATENDELQQRYDAAEELLDAFIERAEEDKEQIVELQERYDAAETLLQESLNMKVEEKIEEYVTDLTKGLKGEKKDTIVNVLNECTTREEVDAKYAQLAPLIGKKVERLPLPESKEDEDEATEKLEEIESSVEEKAEQLDESQHPEAYHSFARMKKSLGIK